MKGRVLAPLVEASKRDNLDILEMQPLQQCSWLVAGVIGFLLGFNYHAKDFINSDQMAETQNMIADCFKSHIPSGVDAVLRTRLREPEFRNALGIEPLEEGTEPLEE